MHEEQEQQTEQAEQGAAEGGTVQMRPYSGILLTIGMIVRDEEENLRACLESLQALRQAVPSELLVTDTGSVDSTTAIAAEFADEVRHIKWCDDFAAARNTTLAAANGEWFFYIDADEVLDADISAITAFFQSGRHLDYAAAECIVRSYEDAAHTKYRDAYACRFHRTAPDRQFQNRVFEELSPAEPVFRLETVLHHDGWAEKERKLQKKERNRCLLAMELQKAPSDERLMRLMVESCKEVIETEQLEAPQRPGNTGSLLRSLLGNQGVLTPLSESFAEQTTDEKRAEYLETVIQLAAQGQRENLVACYQELEQSEDQTWMTRYQQLFQQYLAADATAWAEIAQLSREEPFVVLCRLRGADPDDRDTIYALLDYLQASEEFTVNAPYQEVLYWSVRLNHGMEQLVGRIPPETLADAVRILVLTHDDFAHFVLEWVRSLRGDRQGVPELYWLTELMTLSLLYSYAGNAQAEQKAGGTAAPEKVSAEEGTELFRQAAAALTMLCKRTYSPEMLEPDQMDLLPKLHRMALYVAEAMRKKESGDILSYLQNLKCAAREYPLLSRPMQQMLEAEQQDQDEQQKIAEEFRELAQQVKQQTAQLIEMGEFQEAIKILEVYQAVNPEDQEAADMYRMLQEKQTGLGLQ